MISSGMPKSRADWPAGVLEAAAQFSCGDVVENPPIFYYADPSYGVHVRTREYADSGYVGPEIIDAEGAIPAPFGVITSQTCDLGEIDFDPPSYPFISIAPVFEGSVLDGSDRSLLKKGRRIGPFFQVPELTKHREGFWVLDLRLEVPVEKSWLVGRTPIKGFTEEGARLVPKIIYDLRGRAAWAASVSNELQPGTLLLAELKTLKADNRALYDVLVTEVDEIGARSDSMLSPTWIQLAAFTNGPASEAVVDWLQNVNDSLRMRAHEYDLVVHEPQVFDLDTCPVTTYRQFATFPLGRFSPS